MSCRPRAAWACVQSMRDRHAGTHHAGSGRLGPVPPSCTRPGPDMHGPTCRTGSGMSPRLLPAREECSDGKGDGALLSSTEPENKESKNKMLRHSGPLDPEPLGQGGHQLGAMWATSGSPQRGLKCLYTHGPAGAPQGLAKEEKGGQGARA